MERFLASSEVYSPEESVSSKKRVPLSSPEESEEESDEPRIFHRSLVNEKGEQIGEIRCTYEPERITRAIEEGEFSGFKLITCVIEGPTGSFDIMSLVESLGTRVVMATEPQVAYFYKSGHDIAYIPPLRSLIALAAALHELGHATQFRGPLRRYFQDFVDPAPVPEEMPPQLPAIFSARKYLPALREKLQTEHLTMVHQIHEYGHKILLQTQSIKETQKELEAVQGEREQASVDSVQSLTKKAIELEAERQKQEARVRDLQREIDTRVEVLKTAVPELFQLTAIAQKTMEYDATRRAILFLKEIKEKTGIDVFADTHAEKDLFTDIPCHGTQESNPAELKLEDATNVSDAFYAALSTYEASTEKLRKQYGEVPRVRRPFEKQREEDEAFREKVERDIDAQAV